MAKIEDLLHRRTDLSTFLVHLTRSYGGASARDNLVSMAKTWKIEARNPLGPARDHEDVLGPAGVTQNVVCFTETPLEHIWMMLKTIDGRSMQFQPDGLATTKTAGRSQGCNPVWYSDMTRLGVDWPLKHMRELVDRAMAAAKIDGGHDASKSQNEPFLRLAPYFETMGRATDRKARARDRERDHLADARADAGGRRVQLWSKNRSAATRICARRLETAEWFAYPRMSAISVFEVNPEFSSTTIC